MQKGSAQFLLIFVALVIVLSGLYFFQSTKRSNLLQTFTLTSLKQPELNNYSNSNLGLEFKYDKDLTVKTDSETEFNQRGNGDYRKNFKGYVSYEPGKFIGGVVVLDKTGSYDINPLTIWVFDNPDNLSIDNWYKNYWYYPFVWGGLYLYWKIRFSS